MKPAHCPKNIVLLCVSLLAVEIVASPAADTESAATKDVSALVHLEVTSVSTNLWSGDLKREQQDVGCQIETQYVRAGIEIKNLSTQPVTNKAFMAPVLVDYRLRYSRSAKKPDREISRLRSCPERDALEPGGTRWFPAVIDSDEPCRVIVDFWNGSNVQFSVSTEVIDTKSLSARTKNAKEEKN